MQLVPWWLAALAPLPYSAPPAGVPQAPRDVQRGVAWSEPLDLGDLDGDGLDDLVVAGGAAGDRVLRGRADGGFDEITAGSGLDALAGARALRLADLDGDGRLDLARVAADGGLDLLRGVGGAVFEPWPVATGASGRLGPVRRAAAVDVDGDRRPELVVERVDGALTVLRHVPGAGFAPDGEPPHPLDGAPGPGGVTIAEGLLDTVTGACVYASSAPRDGFLYPMSTPLNVDGSGRVGMGTSAQEAKLHVVGDLAVEAGELIALQGGSVAANAVGSASTGAGGALALYGGGGAPTVTLFADDPLPGPAGSFELRDPATGDGARVHAPVGPASLFPQGRLDLDQAGDLRATLWGYNSAGIVDSPTLDLFDAAGKRALTLTGSELLKAPRIDLRDDGFQRVALSASGGSVLALWDENGNLTALAEGGDDDGPGRLRLRTAEETETVLLEADVQGSGAGRAQLGVEGVGFTARLDGGSDGTGGELVLDQQDGSRAVTLEHVTAGGGSARLALHTAEGHEALVLSRGATGDGLLSMYNPMVVGSTLAIELGHSFLSSIWQHGFVALSTSGKPVAAVVSYGFDHGTIFLLDASGAQEVGWGDQVLALWDASGPKLLWNGKTGQKNAVVDAGTHGARLLYVREGSEGWFEDAGVATVRGGALRVDLDPAFLAVTTVDAAHPLRVFVTPHADRAVLVDVGRDHFVVHSPEGAGDFELSWLIQATRVGFEGVRLEPAARRADGARESGRGDE